MEVKAKKATTFIIIFVHNSSKVIPLSPANT